MKKLLYIIIFCFTLNVYALTPNGFDITESLRIGAVIHTKEKGEIEAIWKYGGTGNTSRGDTVIWGYFYANPSDVSWGTQSNPEVFVKLWFDVNGRVDVNFFHVSVPNIEVFSSYESPEYNLNSVTTLDNRYIRQYYQDGTSEVQIQIEDGIPAQGYEENHNPKGSYTANAAQIKAMINTEEVGSIEAIWKEGGRDFTPRGDQVVWGYFFASTSQVSWGNKNNPEVFVKLWFDVEGTLFINYFHVSAPDIEIYSDYQNIGQKSGTTTQDDRYIRHDYKNPPQGLLKIKDENFSCHNPFTFIEDYRPNISFSLTNTLGVTLSSISMNMKLISPGVELPWADGDGRYKIPGGLASGRTRFFELEPNRFSSFGKDATNNVCDNFILRDSATNDANGLLHFVFSITSASDENGDVIK